MSLSEVLSLISRTSEFWFAELDKDVEKLMETCFMGPLASVSSHDDVI